MPWQPGQRRAAQALEKPYEDVPEHLFRPLWDWISETLLLDHSETVARDVALQLRVDMGGSPRSFFFLKCQNDREFMLDVVEILLSERWAANAGSLRILLDSANSAYTVRNDGQGLEERIAPGVKTLVQASIASAPGSAGDHLTKAWNACYGRNTEPSMAYSEAIKAVESSFAPHVTPQNNRQTLGTIIHDIRNAPHKWHFVIPGKNGDGIAAILAMMQILWGGQTSRHGGISLTRVETLDEARAAVHLAATLVQFGASGAFARA